MQGVPGVLWHTPDANSPETTSRQLKPLLVSSLRGSLYPNERGVLISLSIESGRYPCRVPTGEISFTPGFSLTELGHHVISGTEPGPNES